MARTASTSLTRGYLDRLLNIGASWPVDPLRPDLHFGRAIELASRKALLKRSSLDSPSSSAASSTSAKSESLALRELNGGAGTDVQMIEATISALERLRKNKALNNHPTPTSIMRPASQPNYYPRLIAMLDKAGRGEDVSPTWSEKVNRFFGRD
ncbi:acetylornithine aminotransferase [Tilletia horrida]|nr:acetylornithine aminotransferase [Tilletia horrida]